MLLLLTDGGSMIGITSTPHFLQYSTLAFQTIKIFHHNFLLELIFSFHHWWLENCYEYLQTSPHQIKIFLWFIFILLHIVPLPNVCIVRDWQDITCSKDPIPGRFWVRGLSCKWRHLLPWEALGHHCVWRSRQRGQLLKSWQNVSTSDLKKPPTRLKRIRCPELLEFLSLALSFSFLPIVVAGL